MARVEQSNGTAVTVTSSLGDVVVTPELNNISNNQWIVLTAHFHGTKGGTAGSTIVKLYQKSGTAEFTWLLNSGNVYGWMLPSVPANALHVGYLTYLLRALADGRRIRRVRRSGAVCRLRHSCRNRWLHDRR